MVNSSFTLPPGQLKPPDKTKWSIEASDQSLIKDWPKCTSDHRVPVAGHACVGHLVEGSPGIVSGVTHQLLLSRQIFFKGDCTSPEEHLKGEKDVCRRCRIVVAGNHHRSGVVSFLIFLGLHMILWGFRGMRRGISEGENHSLLPQFRRWGRTAA